MNKEPSRRRYLEDGDGEPVVLDPRWRVLGTPTPLSFSPREQTCAVSACICGTGMDRENKRRTVVLEMKVKKNLPPQVDDGLFPGRMRMSPRSQEMAPRGENLGRRWCRNASGRPIVWKGEERGNWSWPRSVGVDKKGKEVVATHGSSSRSWGPEPDDSLTYFVWVGGHRRGGESFAAANSDIFFRGRAAF